MMKPSKYAFAGLTGSRVRNTLILALTMASLCACTGAPVDDLATESSSSSSIAMSSTSSVSSSVSSNASSNASNGDGTLSLLVTEDATCQIDGVIESDHAGFSGEGYANTDNAIGAGIVWHVVTNSPGSYQLQLRYANGGITDRNATAQVNDLAAAPISFPTTDTWADWESVALTVNLSYGSNLLTLTATTAGGLPNIDSLTIEGTNVTAGNCGLAQIQLPQATIVSGAVANFEAKTFLKGKSLISAYDWDFGDGQNGSGEQTSHTYVMPGDYTVGLTTTDVNGNQYHTQKLASVLQKIESITVYIAGDSTVATYRDTSSPNDQAGWGQMLAEQYDNRVNIHNHAIGGRTSRRFIDEGRLDAIWSEIKAGDYLLVQFGTNDGHRSATYTINGETIPYYLAPATDFKSYLQRYVDGAKARGVNLVFVTPPPRNSAYCTGGNGTGAHAQAMRELAGANNIPVADLNQKSVDYLTNICPAPTPEDFFFRRADGSVDGTHFQENGARIMSRMVADGIAENGLPLNDFRLQQ